MASARGERFLETGIEPREKRKALKGKPHERWGLKKASKGFGADAAERVAKP
jgi:hypothetical protein